MPVKGVADLSLSDRTADITECAEIFADGVAREEGGVICEDASAIVLLVVVVYPSRES